MIFDTHCHAYWHGLAQRQDEVRRNMRAQGVLRSVQIGTDLPTNQKSLDLARLWGDDTWCTAGLHPSTCQEFSLDSVRQIIEQIEKLIRDNPEKVIAVGETGLDYFHLKRSNKAEQMRVQKAFFREQALLSIGLDLPLIVHTRNAAADTISQLKESGVKRAVIHCFSEDPAFAQELLAWSDDIYFSFSGILTYKNAGAVQNTARILPLNRILVETDAPFLVPQIVREEFSVNEPAFTCYVLDSLKALRDEPGDTVEKAVWENSNSFYRIKQEPGGKE
jgi:TatD DNase family protein